MADETKLILGLLALCNMASLFVYWWDKSRSQRGKDRIPEARLLQFTLIGPFGSILGVWWIRHKTQKGSYLLKYFCVLALSLACHAGLAYLGFFIG